MIDQRPTSPAPKLDAMALKALSDHIDERVKKIEEGRKERVKKIQKIRRMHTDDYSDRLENPQSIYKLSNIGVPMMKGVATSYASKMEDELIAVDAPFMVRPQGAEDKVLAEKLQRYWLWELMDQMEYGESASEGIAVACVEGTGIKKRSWDVVRSYFNRTMKALHGPDGKPVLDPSGQMISQGQFPMVAMPPPGAEPMAINGAPPSPPTIRAVPDDYVTQHNERVHLLFGPDQLGPEMTGHTFAEVSYKDFVEHYDNARSELVPFEDFLCELTVKSIDKSPLVGHCYELSVREFIERVRVSVGDQMTMEQFKQTGWVVENLEKIPQLADSKSQGTGSPVSTPAVAQLNQPRPGLGEAFSPLSGVLIQSEAAKTLQLGEMYLKYDVDGDNIHEDIVVIWDRTSKTVFFVEYLVNIYEDCKLPFEVYGFFRVPGRWYGMGPYEYLEMAHEFIDRTFNRMNYRTSMSANPMGWHKPDNFVKPPKTWGPGEKVQLKMSAKIEDSMGFVQMPSLEQVEWKHFEFFLNLVQLCTGVSNAAQGDVASLPSTSTARGISSIIEEGNKLYRMMIRRLQRAMEKEIFGLVALIQQNLQHDRVFRFEKHSEEIEAVVTPDEIRNLSFDVKIVLSKQGIQQKQQAIQSAITIVQSWIQMPPQYQLRMRDMFIQLLTLTGIVEADAILPSTAELKTDQDKDQALQQAAQKIQAAAMQIQGGEMDPSKKVAEDLMGVAQMLAQIATQPPNQGEGAPPAPEGAAAAPQTAPDAQGLAPLAPLPPMQ